MSIYPGNITAEEKERWGGGQKQILERDRKLCNYFWIEGYLNVFQSTHHRDSCWG